MTEKKFELLKACSLKVREHIIRMSATGGCFIGASLSCVEIMVYLYSEFLALDIDKLNDPERDYLFLSKGHDVPALYGTLAEFGFIDKERLSNHLLTNDSIYWHPNRAIPGVEFHSGSLGHLPSVAAGVALDCKIKRQHNHIVAILGDGELNEGSVWETILVANAKQLDNLTLVIDRNQFQANMKTEDLIPLEPLEDKFIAFGCNVKRINGHDFEAIETAFLNLPYSNQKVNIIIADTVRGKGLPSIEAKADRWFCSFTPKEVDQLLEELHGNEFALLESETLIVR
ncbi:MAG: 1-deoxy-D-xylulose-5-phosphate synthase N-terminal domain-containing protein [Ferruginibacter sp.]